jgi:hypothetical protein
VTVAAPPRPPSDDLDAPEVLDALIEEARRRARKRRRRNAAAAALLALAGAAALVGFTRSGGNRAGTTAAPETPRAASPAGPGGIVVVTMRGYVRATRTLHSRGGPASYREAGRFRVVWRVPIASLRRGRTFRSTSAIVTGTTSALFADSPARSCSGTLTPRRAPFLLRVVHTGPDPLVASVTSSDIGLSASPSPIATAVSPTCARGLFAGRWRLTPPPAESSPPSRPSSRRLQNWWVYNHPGAGFYGKSFTPLPKGGNSDGWIQGWGPAGSFAWVAVFTVRRAAATSQASSYEGVLRARYTPIPGLFLHAVEPCIDNRFASCRRADGAVRAAVEALTTALRRASVPPRLARGDRKLRRALAAFDQALRLRIRLAHQATIGPFINADGSIVAALDLMDRAARDLDREDPGLRLRPV